MVDARGLEQPKNLSPRDATLAPGCSYAFDLSPAFKIANGRRAEAEQLGRGTYGVLPLWIHARLVVLHAQSLAQRPGSDQRSCRQLSRELPVFTVSGGRGSDRGWQEVR